MIDLPVPLTSFIGRERDQTAVRELLAGSRLVTLVGPGGCGKTRLAVQVAHDLAATRDDAVYWVDLAPLAEPSFVAQTVAASLGIPEQPDTPLTETLCEGLRARSILLILDNCEHLIASCANLTEQVLQSCPRVRVLITSREALNVAGEMIWPVTGLALPDAFLLPPLEGLLEYEAVQLFLARAAAVQPTFAPVQDDLLPLAHICLRLDGIPLAIELAAARVRVLSLAEIDERLDNAARLLTSGSRKASPHQQTLRGSLDWSYNLLTSDERTFLRYLSVFAASWDLSAVEHITADVISPAADPLDLLARLIEKSLVLRLEGSGGTRYRLQEVVRQYAWSLVVDLHEEEMLRARRRSWCLALVEQASRGLVSPDPSTWLDRLEMAHDDIRAALRWSLLRNDGDIALDLAAPIWRFWLFRGYLSEGRRWLEEGLAATGSDGATPSRAEAALGAGVLANFQADYDRARELCEMCIEYSTALADRRRVGFGLLTLANVMGETGDYEAAARTYEEALVALRDQQDHRATAMALGELSLALLYLGESDRAEEASQESVAMYQLTNNRQGLAGSLTNLAIILLARQEYERAHELCTESLAIRRALGDKGGCAHTLMVLAWAATAQRRLSRAVMACKESLAIREAISDRKGIAQAFEGLARVANISGDATGAVRLLAAASRLRAAAGSRPAPTERAEIERVTARLRSQLDASAFDSAWSEGTEMPYERSLAEARAFHVSDSDTDNTLDAPHPAETASVKPGNAPLADTFGLTAREREVLRLVTQGLTYAQMAEQLVISPRTVDTHLRSIYGKLGVTSRSAATRVALENHLI
ncbi:MAG TPA: tetratricopeptide repeat protein [Ktedonobacterales bacterium]|nr:tetratricopeptide repeat protein [Ktedonobacterales bacterium]